MLSDDFLESYHRDGFAVLTDAVAAEKCLELRARAGEIVEEFDHTGGGKTFSTTEQTHSREEYFLTSGGAVRCFLEEGVVDTQGRLLVEKANSVNKIGHAMHDLDPVFAAFSYTPLVAEVVSQLGIVNPQMLQSMYIFKSPGVGGEVVPHIDHSFLWTQPKSVMTLWYAIDDSTVENGCMWAMPGGHLSEPVRQRFRAEGGSTTMDVYDDTPYPLGEFVPVEAPRGTLVAFDGMLPHFSRHNHSDRPRHAYTVHVIDSDARYLKDNWLHRGEELPLRPLFEEVERLSA